MKAKILVVEDEPDFVKFLRSACKNELPFLEADFAANGFEALLQIVKKPKMYSLVVTDVAMTPISGDDLITILNILNKYAITNLKILTISGKVEDRPGDFIEKPFTAIEFGAKVSELLDSDEA